MKILLVGEYYSTNLGDPLLCRTVQRAIEDAYPDVQVIPFDLSGKTGYGEYYDAKTYSAALRRYFRMKNRCPGIWRRIRQYRLIAKEEARYVRVAALLDDMLEKHTFDMVIFAGGAMFIDHFAGVIHLVLRRVAHTNAKIMFHACGMGHLSADSKRLLQQVLKNKKIKSITLRDSYSRFCDAFRTNAQLAETFDTALACSRFFEAASEKQAEYGVGIIARPDCYEFQKDLVSQFLKSDKKWRLFTNGSREDQAAAEQILTQLGIVGDSQLQWLVPRPVTADELVRTITAFEKIISFRMHSLITAASYGVQCYGFAWDRKVEEMFDKLGIAQNCAKPEGQPSFNEICNILETENGLKEKAQLCGDKSIHALLDNLGKYINDK